MKKFILFIYCSFFLFSVHILAQVKVGIVRYAGIPSNASIHELKVLPDNTKLAATNLGIYELSAFQTEAKKIHSQNTSTIAVSRKGEIWAGLATPDVIHINSNTTISLPDASMEIRNMCISKSMLWVSTNKGLVIINTRNKQITKHLNKFNSALKTNDVRFVFSNDEFVWAGTNKGVYRIKGKQWKHYEKKKRMDVIFPNSEGNWLISEDEMWVIDPFQRWYPAALEMGLKQGPLRDITIDSKGVLYLASEKLVRYDPYKDIIHDYESTLGVLSQKCLSIISDKDDDIWIGTEGSGLYMIRFEDNKELEFSVSCIIEKSIKCEGSGARIIAEVTGGKGPYQFSWSSGQQTARIENALAGNYSLSVTDAMNNLQTNEIEVLSPLPIQVTVVSQSRISSPGKRDGQMQIMVSGGKAPYDIRWDNGEKSTKALKLSGGAHSITITDDNSCKYIHQVEIDREKFIPNLDISKIEVGQTLKINELFFHADSVEVAQNSHDVLDEIYIFLADHPKVVIEIGGHTNNIPPHEYCDKLSTERARNVAVYLFNKGIHEDRISYKGYGKRAPIASNDGLSGRKKNQRVEIKVLSVN